MNNILEDLKYTNSHEWVKIEQDGILKVGITDHAQNLLGDIVYVELPNIGDKKAKEDVAGVVESVKAASDIYMPISGEIVAINDNLAANPELVNKDPYGEGWLFSIKVDNSDDIDSLLSAKDYENLINE